MSKDDRQIRMTARPVTLDPKAPGGLGLRDLLLLALAVLQAGYWIFVNDALAFAVRLVLAMIIGMTLMAAAMVRPRGKTFEQLFAHWFAHRFLRARFATHQTARRDATDLADAKDVAGRRDRQPGAPAEPPDLLPAGDWFAPNYALMVLFFMAVLAMTSAALYLQHGAPLPGLPRWPMQWR